MLVAVERNGSVRTAPVENDSIENLKPVINKFVHKDSHLRTDQLHSYKEIGKEYASHESVNHLDKEYVRGDVHNNTAESFNALIERAKQGVFHYMSKKHLKHYLNEIEFRWNHRVAVIKKTKKRKLKLVMKQMPVITMFRSLLSRAHGKQVRRSDNGGIICLESI